MSPSDFLKAIIADEASLSDDEFGAANARRLAQRQDADTAEIRHALFSCGP